MKFKRCPQVWKSESLTFFLGISPLPFSLINWLFIRFLRTCAKMAVSLQCCLNTSALHFFKHERIVRVRNRTAWILWLWSSVVQRSAFMTCFKNQQALCLHKMLRLPCLLYWGHCLVPWLECKPLSELNHLNTPPNSSVLALQILCVRISCDHRQYLFSAVHVLFIFYVL